MAYKLIRVFTLVCFCLSVNIMPVHSALKPQELNNFVTELFSVRLAETSQREFVFSNPRDGWVIFSLNTGLTAPGKVQVSIDNQTWEKAIITNGKSKTSEAMRRLSAGSHKLRIRTTSKLAGSIVVRTMPEIMFIRYTGDAKSPDSTPYRPSTKEAHGADRLYLYYWDFLSKTILKNVNVLSGMPRPAQTSEWTRQGKEIIEGSWFFTQDPEELFNGWSKSFKSPSVGLIADEFVPPSLGFDDYIIDTIRRIHDAPDLKGVFYAYIGFPWDSKPEDFRKVMEPVMRYNYRWVPEFYLFEQPTEAQARENIDKLLRQRMLDLRKTYPGSEKNCVVCPSILEAWDSIPNVDFKVWLDMQFNTMANDPAFKDIYGVTAYQSTYADPEIILWLSALYRHYCIEGQKKMLSPRYGYTYMTGHIKNGLFAEGDKDWTLTPAENGNIGVKKVSNLIIQRGYLPRGTSVLSTKRSSAKPNVIHQEIRNLKPGKFYSLRMYICEPKEAGIAQKYAVSVNLTEAQVFQNRSRQDIQRGDGSSVNTACWNYIYRVFRATSTKAKLEISDWSSKDAPGGPIEQEIIYDFVQVQPLFEGN